MPLFVLEYRYADPELRKAVRPRHLDYVAGLRERGEVPADVDQPELHLGARSGEFLTAGQPDWQDAYAENFAKAVKPVQRAAE